MNSLNIKALSLSLGLSFAIGVLLLGWAAIFGWGEELVDVLSAFYLGYDATLLGSIIGAIWAFADGAIFGLLIGYFYKKFANTAGKKKVIKNPARKRINLRKRAKFHKKAK